MAAILTRGAMIRQIQALYDVGPMGHLSDGQLLERFTTDGEAVSEAAFGLILDRHGPTVLRVCRGVLGDEHDAQDAFQATFLVLAQRAGSLRRRESVGSWLHGVALRVASAARRKAATRRAYERRGAVPEAIDGPPEPRDDLAPILHEELSRLPDGQRAALVLCHLEGHTHEEAARRLSLPVGTVRSRLARGRDRLRRRLIRRGLAPTAALAAVEAASRSATAAVPGTLRAATLQAASSVAAGKALAASGASATAAALAAETLRGLAWSGVASVVKVVSAPVIVAASAGLMVASAGVLGTPGWLSMPRFANEIAHKDPEPSRTPDSEAVGDVPEGPKGGSEGAVGDVPGQAEGGTGSEESERKQQRFIDLRVIESETGEPIPNAAVILYWGEPTRYATDAEGRARIEAPQDLRANEGFTVNVQKPGYAPTRHSYSADDFESDNTTTAAFKLEPAGVMGGIVQDEQGRPIEGAEVRVIFFTARIVQGRESSILDLPDPVLTDAAGRWRLHMLPEELTDEDYLEIRLAHPDYVSDVYVSSRPRPSIASLRDQSAVSMMSKGVLIQGTVVGPEGEPPAGADVRLIWQSTQNNGQTRPDWTTTTTDADGHFRFEHSRPIEQSVVAHAEGLAPTWLPVDASVEGPVSVTFALNAGQEVLGRVVDDQGEPVADAEVFLSDWHGFATFDWKTTTGADGRFRWEHAPADAFTLSARPAGRFDSFPVEVAPGQEEVTITARSPLQFQGTVTDARTGEPIEQFQVVPGFTGYQPQILDDAGQEQPHWLYRGAKSFEGGEFRFDFDSYASGLPRYVRIEAEGYLPMASRGYSEDDGKQVLNVVLLPGPGVEGVVRDPEGEPVAGVEVFLAGPGVQLSFEDGEVQSGQTSAAQVQTDAKGRFWFAQPDGPFLLLARGEQGVAELRSEDLDATLDIQLKPWARIEGQVRVGAEPGAIEDVVAYTNRGDRLGTEPILSVQHTATADAQGRFTLERILPGEVIVARNAPRGAGTLYSHRRPLDLEPGATVEVTLGGTGRPVVGQLVLQDDTVPLIDLSDAEGMLLVKQPEPFPDDFLSWEPRRKQVWWNEFHKTDEGRAYARRENIYAVSVTSNGTFRIEDVPPGTYTLHISLRKPRVGPGGQVAGATSGNASVEIQVPEFPGRRDRTDEPFDVGDVELTLTEYDRLGVGDVAPDFAIETVEGEPLKLSDYRGKFVLLDFWATWCGPCVEETPILKAVHDAYGDDERFALIGLSLDDEPEAPGRYAETQGLGWVQGHLGAWSENAVVGDYGVQSIPQILLIGPDGKVVAKDLRGEAIKEAVAEALGRE